MLKSLILAAAVSGLSVLAGSASAEMAPEPASGLIAGPAPTARPINLDHPNSDKGDRAHERAMIRASVETFIWGLSHHQAAPVWAFAPETMQKRLKNERTVLTFFSRVHPQLANARSVNFDGLRMVGSMPVAGYYVKDAKGLQWLAIFGIARRDNGSYNIVFCRIVPAPGRLI